MVLVNKWTLKIAVLSLTTFFLTVFPINSEAKVRVVGTTEHEALLAKQVGEDFIEIQWIAGADENPYFVQPVKTLVPILNQADLLLVNGQGIEIGWLDALLTDTGNEKILRGHEHYIDLSENALLLPYLPEEIRQTEFLTKMISQDAGKTVSNHHYWLDPANEIPMINNIKKALVRVDPVHSKNYESNAHQLVFRLEEKIKEWDAKMIPFKGKKIISYHRDWTYLAHRHGLEIVSYLEPGEMVRPKEEDFRNLSSRFKGRQVSAILLTENQRPPFVRVDSLKDLTLRLHAKLILLPDSMNEAGRRTDVVAFFDQVYDELIETLKSIDP
ncbi:MAG: metal ABC transporter substrate-binding protein [Nitrospiria bacterium]